jgi:hypothetical protein
MNQQQVKYTIERVALIEKRKIEELRTSLTTPASNKTDDEIVTLIATGEVRIRQDIKRDRNSWLQVSDIFDLSNHVFPSKLDPSFTARSAAISAQAAKIKDEIMLGDQQAALALLREFDA